MIANTEVISYITKNDFSRLITFPYVEANPVTNQWTYDDLEKAAYVVDTAKNAYFSASLGNLYIGDLIEFEFEVFHPAGEGIEVVINSQNRGSAATVKTKSISGEGYKKYRLRHIAHENASHSFVIRTPRPTIDNFKIRNLMVRLVTKRSNFGIPFSEQRKASIYNPTGGSNFILLTSKNNSPCIITTRDTTTLEVNFDGVLFNEGTSFVSQEWTGLNKDYLVRSSFGNKKGLRLQFFHVDNLKTAVELSTLPSNIHVSMMLIN